ncbi:hypothetical protein CSC94_18955 [Zhengella mangrovi]|uniref:Probable membrane transporter protein n=1 Tax=Zhengella mangrovi TaxID=1982044 RepID=A0A2G1QJ03_9HYPH|nr:sulfite exporter TauE/SafE family protein [Zhengella mangrovi]PHP65440.1 hypothetical protein CSC94_18955 [Zhengella mangrovi]
MSAFLGLSQFPPALIVAVFAASLLQSVTGIGFGVIAGPLLLASVGSASAIQASIVLSLLIAVILAPGTLRLVSGSLLRPVFLGICIGTPVGGILFMILSIDALKTLAAITVGTMTVIASGVLSRYPVFEIDTPRRRMAAGAISGVLNTTLAMPGPPIAAYATAIRSDKAIIRATTLVAFLLAYPIAFGMQHLVAGISADLWAIAAPLSLPTIAGVLAGSAIARHVNEQAFKWLTVGFLLASVTALVVS